MNYITVTATATEDAKIIKGSGTAQAFSCHVEVPSPNGKEDAYNTTTKLRVEIWGPNAVALIPKITKGNRLLIEGGQLYLAYDSETQTSDNYIKGGQLRWIPPTKDIAVNGFEDINSIFLTGRTNKHISETLVEGKNDTVSPQVNASNSKLSCQLYTNNDTKTASKYWFSTTHWSNQKKRYANQKEDPNWVQLLVAKFSKRHTPITIFGKIVSSPGKDGKGDFVKIELAKRNGITLGPDILKDWVPRESQSVTTEEPKSVPSPTMIDTQEVWGSIETTPTEEAPSIAPQPRTEVIEATPEEVPF